MRDSCSSVFVRWFLCLVIAIAGVGFPFYGHSRSPQEISSFDIEGLRLGLELDVVRGYFDSDNRWEGVELPGVRAGGLFANGLTATLNTDGGRSCKLDGSVHTRAKKVSTNPPLIRLAYHCKYKVRPNYDAIISELEQKRGLPDYVEYRGKNPAAYIYVGTNDLSGFEGWEDLSQLCAKEIRASGKAGTDSKALGMAKQAVPSGMPFKDIQVMQGSGQHKIKSLCPGVGGKYLTHLEEIYSPSYTFEFKGDRKLGIRSTRELLVDPLKRRSAAHSGRKRFVSYSEHVEKLKSHEALVKTRAIEKEKRKIAKQKNKKEREEARLKAKQNVQADRESSQLKQETLVKEKINSLPSDVYGSDILGIKLGMSIDVALERLDARFKDGWRYDLKSGEPVPDSNFFNFFKNASVYISSDVKEIVILYYEPSVLDKVTGLSRKVSGSSGELPTDLNSQMIEKYGEPSKKTSSGPTTTYAWDERTETMVSRCDISSFGSLKVPISAKVFGEGEPEKGRVKSLRGTITLHIGQKWRQEPTKKHMQKGRYAAQRLECGPSLQYRRTISKREESMMTWVSDPALQLKVLSQKQNVKKPQPPSEKKMDL